LMSAVGAGVCDTPGEEVNPNSVCGGIKQAEAMEGNGEVPPGIILPSPEEIQELFNEEMANIVIIGDVGMGEELIIPGGDNPGEPFVLGPVEDLPAGRMEDLGLGEGIEMTPQEMNQLLGGEQRLNRDRIVIIGGWAAINGAYIFVAKPMLQARGLIRTVKPGLCQRGAMRIGGELCYQGSRVLNAVRFGRNARPMIDAYRGLRGGRVAGGVARVGGRLCFVFFAACAAIDFADGWEQGTTRAELEFPGNERWQRVRQVQMGWSNASMQVVGIPGRIVQLAVLPFNSEASGRIGGWIDETAMEFSAHGTIRGYNVAGILPEATCDSWWCAFWTWLSELLTGTPIHCCGDPNCTMSYYPGTASYEAHLREIEMTAQLWRAQRLRRFREENCPAAVDEVRQLLRSGLKLEQINLREIEARYGEEETRDPSRCVNGVDPDTGGSIFEVPLTVTRKYIKMKDATEEQKTQIADKAAADYKQTYNLIVNSLNQSSSSSQTADSSESSSSADSDDDFQDNSESSNALSSTPSISSDSGSDSSGGDFS
jgi:hypothetical protein